MSFGIAITALVVLLVFAVYLVVEFAAPVIEILVNLPLLYIIFIRAKVEIEHGRRDYYLWGLAVAAVLFVVFGKFSTRYYVWWFTQLVVLAFVFAQVYFYITKNIRRKKR
ncbi:hypothetical protein GF351_06305 [Candidatus Woesearchaeota archaeon]|nr:hypothetical protein [Candidatus Woesearchaeota archaeon]